MSQQQQSRELLLSSGFIRQSSNVSIPIDIINIICMFLHIVFDFDIIDKRYGTKDRLEIDDIPPDTDTDSIIFGTDIVPIVITIDSGSIKAGFAGEDHPIIVIPNIIGKTKDDQVLIGNEIRNTMSLAISSPIQNGDIEDWDSVKAILWRIVSGIKAKRNLAILITECVGFSKKSREAMTEFVFEKVGALAFYTISRSTLSLYASGRTTGMVIYSDYHCTEIQAISEGYLLTVKGKKCCKKINIGRRDILRYLEKNGDKLERKNDAFDIMFDPQLRETEEQRGYDGLAEAVFEVFKSCGNGLAKDMSSNLVLAGLNVVDIEDEHELCDKDKFRNKLEKRLYGIKGFPPSMRVKITGLPNEENPIHEYGWLGGSILASLSTFTDMWMLKKEYDECGVSFVHEKMMIDE